MAFLSMLVIMLYLLICFGVIIAIIAAVLGIGGVGLVSAVSGIVLTVTGKKSEHSKAFRIIGTILLIVGIIALAVFGVIAYFIFLA